MSALTPSGICDSSGTRPRGQRVVGLDDQIELPEGTLRLRYATLDGDHTAVSAVYTPHGTRRSPGSRVAGEADGTAARALSNAVLADDQGNTASLAFSGSGSDYRWELTLTADQPLATDTSWLELAGRRIRLLDPRPVDRQIKPLGGADPAHRHLWRQVALNPDSPEEQGLGASIDALTATGALDPADPVIELVHQVGEGEPGHVSHASGNEVVRGEPKSWQALRRRERRTDGPKGTVFVGAITPRVRPSFCGGVLPRISPDSFSIEAAVSPPDSEHDPGQSDFEDPCACVVGS